MGNVAADRTAALLRAVRGGELDAARAINAAPLTLTDAVTGTSQGAVMAKAALTELGVIPHATVRLPLLPAPPADLRRLTAALEQLTTAAAPAAGARCGTAGRPEA